MAVVSNTKFFATIAAAIVFGSVVYLLTPAGAEVMAAASDHRLMSRPLGRPCGGQAWPYYESQCLRDARQPGSRARAVRIVSTDRLPTAPISQVALQYAPSNNQARSIHDQQTQNSGRKGISQ
jgi:hypothetical protein